MRHERLASTPGVHLFMRTTLAGFDLVTSVGRPHGSSAITRRTPCPMTRRPLHAATRATFGARCGATKDYFHGIDSRSGIPSPKCCLGRSASVRLIRLGQRLTPRCLVGRQRTLCPLPRGRPMCAGFGARTVMIKARAFRLTERAQSTAGRRGRSVFVDCACGSLSRFR